MTTYGRLFFEDADLYRVIKVGHVMRFRVYPAVANRKTFERNVGDGGEEGVSCGKRSSVNEVQWLKP